MPYIDRVNVDGVDYALEPVMDGTVTDTSHKPVSSEAVYELVDRIAGTVAEHIQARALSEPIDIFGTVVSSVMAALSRLSSYYTDTPASSSKRLYTAGGAYTDKTDTPAENDNRNFTAGGAYADKTDTPAYNSSKNFTAGGAYADKTDTPAYGDDRSITAAGVFAFKNDLAESGSSKTFTAGGAFEYFAHCDTALAWLKKVFGSDYETKVSNGYFVD